MYDDVQFALGRLRGTIVRIHGEPSYILGIDENRVMTYTDTTTKLANKYISLDNKGVDLTPIPIGYVNTKRGATYLVRLAKRRWKQGLDQEGIRTVGRSYLGIDYTATEQFLACLKGEYPSFKEATSRSKELGSVVAFSRKWAIDYLGTLFFRGKVVGHSQGGLHLNGVYKYLTELLEEAL